MELTHSAARMRERAAQPLLPSVLRATLFVLLVSAILLPAVALILYRNDDPGRLLTPVGLACLAVVSLLCGFRAGRLRRQSGLLCGLLSGLLFAFLLFLTALILKGGKLPLQALPIYLGVVLLSLLGGLLGARKKKARRHKHR